VTGSKVLRFKGLKVQRFKDSKVPASFLAVTGSRAQVPKS
jgi:hypothetical protein